MRDDLDIRVLANALRFLSIDAVERAGSGHPGMPMGFAEAMVVLARDFLRVDPSEPRWHDRDRLVLSVGHGSMLLYACGYLLGYKDIDIEQLRNFRQWGSRTAGHPEYGLADMVETTTGPLAQGLGNGVGFALAERILAARFGKALVDHYTYVIAGDGCLMEGLSHEACSLAGHLGLGKLIVLFDDNGISIDGGTNLAVSDDHRARLSSYGWHTQDVDGYNEDGLRAALTEAQQVEDAPSFIAVRTTIGLGAPNKQASAQCHGSPLGADEAQAARKALGWQHPPFHVPDDVLAWWRAVPNRSKKARLEWQKRLQASPQHKQFEGVMGVMSGDKTHNEACLQRLKETFLKDKPTWATRKSSGAVLAALMADKSNDKPLLVGGSADLSGSNQTQTTKHRVVTRSDYGGDYIHYGVREHGMAAAMNGMSLHGGIVPYGGTFLVFSDYARPSMRLSALMGLHVIYVMTHDSIGLGEDGPTHQPIEHLASLRAIPRLLVLRPADAIEVAECWQIALTLGEPSVLVLSRQGLPTLPRSGDFKDNASLRGGYVVFDEGDEGDESDEKIALLASGSEVHIALEAAHKLRGRGVGCRVVSMPCFALFDRLSPSEQMSVLGGACLRLAIEAARGDDWARYVYGLGSKGGDIVALNRFGASAPAPQLYANLGITAENLYERACALLARCGQ